MGQSSSSPVPTAFTFGNEHRNDLVGPGYFNVDFDARRTLRSSASPFSLDRNSSICSIAPNLASQTTTSNRLPLEQSAAQARQGGRSQFGLKLLF